MCRIEIEPELLWAMYHGEKLTLQEVADEFGVCLATILRLMKKQNVERRGSGHPGRNFTLDSYQDKYIFKALMRYENHKKMRG